MLQLVEVSKAYRDGAEVYSVLEGVDFALGAGQLAVLTGASGSGKTTLLNIAGCLTRPSRGSVWLHGEEVSHLPDHFLCEVRKHALGLIFQQYHLLPGYTALENVEIPLLPLGIGERERRTRAGDLLDALAYPRAPIAPFSAYPAANNSASRWPAR